MLLLISMYYSSENVCKIIISIERNYLDLGNVFSAFVKRAICDLWNQCDQIGRFLKALDNEFALKNSPKLLLTFGLFCKNDKLM